MAKFLTLSQRLSPATLQRKPISPAYIHDLIFSYNAESCYIQKISDDKAIVGRVSEGNELECRGVIWDFVNWWEQNHLCITAGKTKELVIDFRKKALHTG